MKNKLSKNLFGICIRNKKNKILIWFKTKVAQQKKIAQLLIDKQFGPETRIEWEGHFDDLVHTTSEFSRKLHRRFFQIQQEEYEIEDGWISSESIDDFCKFVSINEP